MTREDKADLLALLSSLWAPPDEALLEMLAGPETKIFLKEVFAGLNLKPGFLPQIAEKEKAQELLGVLKEEYGRLFMDWPGERISLVESTYKPWSQDPSCSLAFAREKGLLMGDSALHLSQIFRGLSLEIPPEFRGAPDHLAIELEFLSWLYRAAIGEVLGFIRDHLDWVFELKAKILAASPHPFYQDALELLDRFLRQEQEKGSKESHGP